MTAYPKSSQSAIEKTHKTCDTCLKNREMRFFSSKRARTCGDCKRKKWNAALKRRPGKLKQKAWFEFSRYIRLRDCLKTTGTTECGVCITCGEIKPFKELQAGHFVGGRSGAVLFDEQIVNAQCVKCNVFLKGNYSMYTLKMIDRYGRIEVEGMLGLKKRVHQYKSEDYESLIEKYKKLADSLLSNNI